MSANFPYTSQATSQHVSAPFPPNYDNAPSYNSQWYKGSSACYVTLKIPYILSFVALNKKNPGQTLARSMTSLT